MVRATIIIDCGRRSGLGRVRRTLTLVDAFKAQGVEPRLYLSDAEGAALVEARGYSYQVGMPETLVGDILVLDNCTLDGPAITELCKQAAISCVIDDLGERPVICDYVINPNLYATGVDYSNYSVKKVFYGPTHSLLSAEFFEKDHRDSDRRGVVVSFGGTDNGALAAAVAELLAAKTSEPIYVPVPKFLKPAATLLAVAKRNPNIKPLIEPDMAVLLRRTSVYVGAAGATVLEALASGCSVCVAATQKDQMQNVAYLPKIGVPALDAFHADAMVAMVEQLSHTGAPKMSFNIDASRDIATAALEAYHRAA